MKLEIGKRKKAYIKRVTMRLSGFAIAGAAIMGNELGLSITSSPLLIAVSVLIIFVGIGVYRTLINRPFAEVTGDSLVINSVKIEKSKIKSMEYRVEQKDMHILRASIEGYSDWNCPIEKDDVDLEDLAVYNFINNNLYPLKVVN